MGLQGMVKAFLDRPQYFKGQNYSALVKHHEKLKTMFSDPLFPASDSSIALTRSVPGNIEWKRPKELCAKPRLFPDASSSKGIVQGELGNGWFVSACSVLTNVKELLYKVIPGVREQDWDSDEREFEIGIFHFCFWRFGEWVDVVIDDCLPTINGQLIFTHPAAPDAFWCALLEKAYAKLNGSYEALQEGSLCDALVDFTGGVSQTLDLMGGEYASDEDAQSRIFSMLVQDIQNHALMCASIVATAPEDVGVRSEVGLIKGRAYGITAVKKVSVGDHGLKNLFRGKEKLCVVRLRDPYGESTRKMSEPPEEDETKEDSESVNQSGSYAYSSAKLTRLLSKFSEWSKLTESQREGLGLTFDAEGELWMPFEDFLTHFNELCVCRMMNTNVFTLTKTWKEEKARGGWTVGMKGTSADRAGGSTNFPETFLRNPQYLFDIRTHEEDFVVQLLQWDVKDQQHVGVQNLVIGFSILKVYGNLKYRLHKLRENCPILVSTDHIRTRELYYEGTLGKGRYLIIPTTFKPEETGEFLVRIFTTNGIHLRELKKDIPSRSGLRCVCPSYTCVTLVKVKAAEGLPRSDRHGACDPFCIVKCEGATAQSSVVKNSLDPVWNATFVFYRKKLNKPILVQVFSKNVVLRNKFLGQAKFPAPINHEPTLIRAELFGRGDKKEERMAGVIEVEVMSDDDLFSV